MKPSRFAVFRSKDQPFTIESAPIPDLRDGEILVRNEYTTLCRSDLNTYAGKRVEKTPTILGHEIVGRIESLGPNPPPQDCRGALLRVGDRITWAIYASDPCSCLARAGIPQKGEGLFKYGHEQIAPGNSLHGGLSEYCILRRHTPVVRIDAPIPLPILALINCSVATVAGALRIAGGVQGRTVLIAGAGMLGIIAAAMCRQAGAAHVIACDIDHDRLSTSRDFGVDLTLQRNTPAPPLREHLASVLPGEPVTVALDFSGVPEAMEELLSALGIGGTLVLIGATYPQRPLQVHAEALVRNVHTIRGLHNYNEQDFIAAVEFIEQHHAHYPFERLVHDRFNLEQVNEAFQYGLSSGAHRVGVRTDLGQPG